MSRVDESHHSEQKFRINGELSGWTIDVGATNRIVIDLDDIDKNPDLELIKKTKLSPAAAVIKHALVHSQWLETGDFDPDAFRTLNNLVLKE